jgi:hypothetical protein
MKKFWSSVVVAAALLALPVAGVAAYQTKPAQKGTEKAATSKPAAESTATHSTKGTVKTIDDSSLVISHGSGAKAQDMTFQVNSSTKKEGNPAAGSNVSVRYRTEGKNMIATAIAAAPDKAAAKAPTKPVKK